MSLPKPCYMRGLKVSMAKGQQPLLPPYEGGTKAKHGFPPFEGGIEGVIRGERSRVVLVAFLDRASGDVIDLPMYHRRRLACP